MNKVVRISDKCPGAIRVDRTTPWGNPFYIGPDGDRDDVCDNFETYAEQRLKDEPNWLDPLVNKDLACWCAPLRCHAETLIRLANGQEETIR